MRAARLEVPKNGGHLAFFETRIEKPITSAFNQEYETVRRAEGRAGRPEFYQALPFQDLSGRRRADWRIRAASYRALMGRIVQPMERHLGRALVILDLGAGNGWLSNRLAQRGHALGAVDLLTNDWDGLGAYIHYTTAFEPIQAEFEALPVGSGEVDLAIFNASLHYAAGYEAALGEAIRTLKSMGEIVILDSPLYRDETSGRQMVAEREADFNRRFGFPSNALPSENFLTEERLAALSGSLGLRWDRIQPWYGLKWASRGLRARLLREREPARFVLLHAKNPG